MSEPAFSQRAPSVTFLSSTARVFEIALGQVLASRRTIFMALVLGAPVLVALILRGVQAVGLVPLKVNGVGVGGVDVFGMMIWVLFVRFVVPILALFYGIAIIGDELEEKTLTYLFVRPIRRGAVLLGKYLAYVVCTALVVLSSVMIVFFLIVPFRQIGASFQILLIDLGILALGLIAYGALFALIGATMKWPLAYGVVFVFLWEPVALAVPGRLRHFTLAHYLQALVPHTMPAESGTSLLQVLLTSRPSTAVCLSVLGLATVVSLVLATRTVEQREYVLEQ